ncbi:SDR family NAD(P)-dependent oxidoreductase [Halogeometricum borinquense]|uniref:SDR family NAD(P)-dependent oxidoreductase n=1 Tax=Halogeometricum borinquense TaxID=60847 RepID=A0A6C0UI39_9EURY|nr:oxidoreductase [Halogeometricum borinquense]QIB75095.1 SDR family NAD(P)-dependent oxidoreductase [Halogeometricum borinquense]QIQ75924.1 SDR family NAD(P)-dependent oxidoreductase [Halogeometricum borinquense]
MSSQWTADDVPDCSGKTVVVTGANSGLGYEATKALAAKGAHVVMTVRSPERGREAAHAVQDAVADADLTLAKLDLADLDSVRRFSEWFHDTFDELHVLANNAGVMAIPRRETEQGFEMQFGVNHLGHFALTGLLLDRLRETEAETRVVTQSSGIHQNGEMDFSDPMAENSYDKWAAYAQSKLANLLFAYELQRRLERVGEEGVLSVGCHPGYAATNLQRRGPEMTGSFVRKLGMGLANRVFAQSAEMGALPMLYAATADDVRGGSYIGPTGLFGMRGYPGTATSSEASHDEDDAHRLWELSEDLTGVTYGI